LGSGVSACQSCYLRRLASTQSQETARDAEGSRRQARAPRRA